MLSRPPADILVMAIALAILCGLMLAGVGLSALCWWHSARLAHSAGERIQKFETELESARSVMQATLNQLRSEIREIERPPAIELLPSAPRPGMNLAKRAQVLRMHRTGESPEKIAAALEIPLQEVNLLLKVHRIVISSI